MTRTLPVFPLLFAACAASHTSTTDTAAAAPPALDSTRPAAIALLHPSLGVAGAPPVIAALPTETEDKVEAHLTRARIAFEKRPYGFDAKTGSGNLSVSFEQGPGGTFAVV